MKLLDSAKRARLPWESADSISDIGQRSNGALSLFAENDSPEMIEKCLNCPRPDCNECLSIRAPKRRGGGHVSGQTSIWGD